MSWKLCLNVWSQRWLKPSLNLVSYCIPFGLSQRKTLKDIFASFKMLLLKLVRLLQLRMFKPSFLHSVTIEGKIEFLKQLCFTLKWGRLSLFLVIEALLEVFNTIFCFQEVQILVEIKASI